MTYATLEQLTDRFGEQMLIQLTDRATPPAGMIDVLVIDRALADADAVVNASLAVRYRLPLEGVPELITGIALAIAIYQLHVFAPDPKIEKDHDRALKSLRDIASGAARLDIAGLEPATSGGGGVQAIDRVRPMSPESLRGFI